MRSTSNNLAGETNTPIAWLTRAVSSNTTLSASDVGYVVEVTTGASDITITMPASGVSDGDLISIQKVDTGVGKVIVTGLAELYVQRDNITSRYDGAWTPFFWDIASKFDSFTSSGTWTKPPLCRSVEVLVVSGGSGGGSGRKGAAGTDRSGGAGGAGGTAVFLNLDASQLGATESVTVGAGGAGGTIQSTNDSNGNSGSSGGSSVFGTHIQVFAGTGGTGGTTSAPAGGVARILGGTGAPGVASGAAGTVGTELTGYSAGGGSGGGIPTANTFSGGGNGQQSINIFTNPAGGSVDSQNGAAGTALTIIGFNVFGSGGAGASSSVLTNAGTGGAGARCAGGGGGGACQNGVGSSGAGGAGGAGCVIVQSYF